jgi:hypothetical protein
MTVVSLRARPGLASNTKIQALLDSLNVAHAQWRERKVVQQSADVEQIAELVNKANLDHDDASPTPVLYGTVGNTGRFLGYTPMRIFNPFLASRLNNWRAVRLHISLIEEPMWGRFDGPRFVSALDICRTYAALGEERRYLGAEKAVGLFLAGVAFGGPKMYAVDDPISSLVLIVQDESTWVLEQLEELTKFHPIALTFATNLQRVWKTEGNYWTAMSTFNTEAEQ